MDIEALDDEAVVYSHDLGPVVIDLEGVELTANDRRRLEHPMTGGVILFSRNFIHLDQLRELTAEIAAIRPNLFIAVDHEGGRVQRFRQGFTHLPPMSQVAKKKSPELFHAIGYLIGSELRSAGLTFSFTPVLDLNYGRSKVIGDRSLGDTVEEVAANATQLIQGLLKCDVPNCGKHFPGHGWPMADSHVALPVDERDEATLLADARIYEVLAPQLSSVMTAHVSYQAYGGQVATYEPRLLQNVLRERFDFGGIIFSDDLSMKGSMTDASLTSVVARAERALESGCDMVLHCNHFSELDELLDGLAWQTSEAFEDRIGLMLPSEEPWDFDPQSLREHHDWQQAHALLEAAGLLR